LTQLKANVETSFSLDRLSRGLKPGAFQATGKRDSTCTLRVPPPGQLADARVGFALHRVVQAVGQQVLAEGQAHGGVRGVAFGLQKAAMVAELKHPEM
jgi:hypothetical protein